MIVDGIKVTYKDGSVGKIRVRKEVILCAGSINTPQLLLLSGIGSVEDLDKFQVIHHPLFAKINIQCAIIFSLRNILL